MDVRSNLMCFQHCDRGSNIFCFNLPKECPTCGIDLSTADLRIPPFRIPLPFTDAETNPKSIVIKPANGSFLRDFRNGDLLHAGITNSDGFTVEFDERGIHFGRLLEWKECLAFNIDQCSMFTQSCIDTSWLNPLLFQIVTGSNKRLVNIEYDGESNNCFDFVLNIVELMSLSGTKTWTKTTFVEDVVSPAINKAIRLISLYRKTEEKGVHVSKVETFQ